MIRRFTALFWKEWMGLQPFFVLLVALFVFGLIWMQCTEFMDEFPIWSKYLLIGSDQIPITFILCLVATLGLLTRERDEGSLQFLDGLPVSRFSLYLAKWLAAFLMITLFELIWVGEALVYEWLSTESLSPPTPWNHVATFSFLNAYLCAFFISVLMPLSFLRLWALLALGVIFWGLTLLDTWNVPYAVWLNPFRLVVPPASIDDGWTIPWKHLGVLTVIGSVHWCAGLLLFSRRDGARGGGFRRFRQSFWGKLFMLGSVVMIVVVWFGLLVFQGVRQLEEEGFEGMEPVEKPLTEVEKGNRIERITTRKFEFVYRKRIEEKLVPLTEQSDEIFEKVVAYLEASPDDSSGRTVVDLTNPLGSHNAGQAYWKKVRMSYPDKGGLEEARAILGHELAHVLMERISRGRLGESFGSARWFHEGVASHVEFQLFRPEDAVEEYHRWLALGSTWGEVHFAELVDDNLLGKRRDPNLVYPAGLLWVQSGVDVYGDDFAARLLRALGREGAPRKLEGMQLWRDTSIAAGFDLERVRSRFRARLAELRETYREECLRMPEISEAEVKRAEGKIVITPVLPSGWKKVLPAKTTLVCRMRPDAGDPPMKWRYSKLKGNRTFSVSALEFLNPKFEYQIGYLNPEWCQQPVFGEWVEGGAE